MVALSHGKRLDNGAIFPAAMVWHRMQIEDDPQTWPSIISPPLLSNADDF
jgi:hypothetical protein